MLAQDLNYLKANDATELLNEFDCEGKMLRSLQQSLKLRLTSNP